MTVLSSGCILRDVCGGKGRIVTKCSYAFFMTSRACVCVLCSLQFLRGNIIIGGSNIPSALINMKTVMREPRSVEVRARALFNVCLLAPKFGDI